MRKGPASELAATSVKVVLWIFAVIVKLYDFYIILR